MASPASQPPDADALTRAIAAGVAAGAPPVDEELWERRMKALTLRNAGGTFTQIAAQLKISPTVARSDVRAALREVLAETVEDSIARQRSVLLDMQRGAYPLAMRGDKDSIMAIVRCLEQEAKLLGLYAPTRQVVGISDVDFAEQAAELISKLGLTPPKELMIHARRDTPVADMAGAVDASEIVDGIVERLVGGDPFDRPAYDLPVSDDDSPLGSTIGDDAISRAAAAAIDPDTYGDDADGADRQTASDGHPVADQGGTNGWSNL